MSEQPQQVNFCCAVAEDKTMKLRDKVHWLHISADEYWAKFEAAAAVIRTLREDIDNYAEALHDLGVADWDTSAGARGGALARAEQIARLSEAVGLLNSMVLSGEQHSDMSRQAVAEALS